MAHTRASVFVALRDSSCADNVGVGPTTVAARLDGFLARRATPACLLADRLARASGPERVEAADGRIAHALASRSVACAVARARRVGSGRGARPQLAHLAVEAEAILDVAVALARGAVALAAA